MKRILFILLIFISVLFIQQTLVFGKEKQKPQLETIHVYEEDITGDGKKDKIELKGTKFDKTSPYFINTEAQITTSNDKKFNIPLPGGYDPTLQFIDLNHDQVNDIFYQSATGGSGGLYNHQLYTLKNNKLVEIPLPTQQYVEGSFQDEFKVSLRISPVDKPIIINVQNRKDDYIRLGIYNKEGKLQKGKSEIMIDPIAFYEPILIGGQKGYGLKSYQQVSGAYHADQLGTIETIWYFENGKWIALNTKWVPSQTT
ncbi:hypothetical protein ACFFIS_09485 [Virgibacillus soli]|uniref:Uncharacterized protein n=1 Tax=Paracerasibacillus soli TaxID=480284 RepID=A0ABU5CQU2_9BACI|nr:hypothetical protein [Virgibacillus soli]MDY0408742.1 hypothetical protein [Virgibacillus soli]